MTIDTRTEAVKTEAQFYREYGFPKAAKLLDALAAERSQLKRQLAEAWTAVRVRDETINVTVKRLRLENEALKTRLEAMMSVTPP